MKKLLQQLHELINRKSWFYMLTTYKKGERLLEIGQKNFVVYPKFSSDAALIKWAGYNTISNKMWA